MRSLIWSRPSYTQSKHEAEWQITECSPFHIRRKPRCQQTLRLFATGLEALASVAKQEIQGRKIEKGENVIGIIAYIYAIFT